MTVATNRRRSATLADQPIAPVAIIDLMSQKNFDAMERGIHSMKKGRYNPETQRPGPQTERSAGEAFRAAVTEIMGIQQFCEERNIPYEGDPQVMIDKAAEELGITDEFKQVVVDGIDVEECAPAVMLATGSEAPVWNNIKDLSPQAYEQLCPSTIKQQVVKDEAKKARIAEAMAKGTTKSRADKDVSYELPSAKVEQQAEQFRESLSASQIRQYRDAVALNRPFDTDAINKANDFLAKFQKNGYTMADGGMSKGQAERLLDLQKEMPKELAKAQEKSIGAMETLLSMGKEGKAEVKTLGLVIEGKPGDFTVSHAATGKPLMTVEGGNITKNTMPTSVAFAATATAETVKQMEQMLSQQQQPQATKAKAAKSKGVELE